MTAPQDPGDQPLAPEPGWDDERLAAAFAGRAARVVVPTDLVAGTLARVRPSAAERPWWGRLVPVGAAAALLVVVGGGLAILGGSSGLLGGGSGVTFREGPTPDLRTLDAGTFAVDFPIDWLAYTTDGATGSGGSIMAVLSTQPVEDRCNGLTGVDINCVYEQRLESGQMRIVVGTGAYRGQTIFDRADIENGTTTRLGLGGMPALVDEYDDVPDDYYQADQSATWQIATPMSLSTVVRLEFMAREPDADAARQAAQAVAESIRFTPPPTPLPDDPAAGIVAARAALDAEAASFRQGFVSADDTDVQTYLDCLAPVPGEDRVMDVGYGPGGDLGWTVLTRCRWFVTPVRNHQFWQLATVYEWRISDEVSWYGERYYIDATGAVVARSSSGDTPPPAGSPDEGVAPAASCDEMLQVTAITCASVLGLGDQAGARVDRVRIWLTSLGAVRSTMDPAQRTSLPSDETRVWAMVFDGEWRCCPNAVDENGQGIPSGSWTTWLVVAEADREATGFTYIQDWSDRAVPEHLPGAAQPEPNPDPSFAPTPPAWGPWPPDGSEVIELPNDDPDAPARVAVVDLSGSLVEVRAPTAQDGQPDAPDEAFLRDPADDGRYRLRWGTTICDLQMTVTIDADLSGIVIEHAPRNGCDAMGIRRELVLEFARDVDPAAVTLEVIPAERLPEAVAPGVPDGLFGLEVIDVEAALAIQARPDDDREIAVRGWLWLNRAIARCRISPETWMFGRDCGLWDTLRESADGGPEMPLYFGPAVSGNPTAEESGLEIVIVGHFDDRRSDACGLTFAERCADVFVVDTMWMNGAPVSRDWTIPPDGGDVRAPFGTADDAAAAALSVFDDDPTRTMPHDAWVLSVGLMPGRHLAELEPTLRPFCGPDCDALFQSPAWIWHVTVLDRTTSELRTFVISDAEFGDQGSIIMREPTIDEVVEHST